MKRSSKFGTRRQWRKARKRRKLAKASLQAMRASLYPYQREVFDAIMRGDKPRVIRPRISRIIPNIKMLPTPHEPLRTVMLDIESFGFDVGYKDGSAFVMLVREGDALKAYPTDLSRKQDSS